MPSVVDDSMVELVTRVLVRTASLVPTTASLTREGAPELLAEALARGGECTGDFTSVDHLALADLALSEVRERFGVPPLRS